MPSFILSQIQILIIMGKQSKINKLRSLPLEERAKAQEAVLPCSVILITFFCGFIPGLYYWLGDSFIFDYYTVSPFWGFVIFTIAGIVVLIVISGCFAKYWEEYDEVIKAANQEIKEKIENGEGSQEELFHLKKEYIERKIGKETLTTEEFEWHSKHFCWGCGKEQKREPKPYVVTQERTESWKEGVYRYTRTFKESAVILICPECYDRLMKSDCISAQNSNIVRKFLIGLYVIIAIGTFLSVCIPEFQGENPSYFTAFGGGLFAVLICYGLCISLGQIILVPLAGLLAFPFMNLNGSSSKTKWSFDEIPKIRKFKKKDLPHTH